MATSGAVTGGGGTARVHARSELIDTDAGSDERARGDARRCELSKAFILAYGMHENHTTEECPRKETSLEQRAILTKYEGQDLAQSQCISFLVKRSPITLPLFAHFGQRLRHLCGVLRLDSPISALTPGPSADSGVPDRRLHRSSTASAGFEERVLCFKNGYLTCIPVPIVYRHPIGQLLVMDCHRDMAHRARTA